MQKNSFRYDFNWIFDQFLFGPPFWIPNGRYLADWVNFLSFNSPAFLFVIGFIIRLILLAIVSRLLCKKIRFDTILIGFLINFCSDPLFGFQTVDIWQIGSTFCCWYFGLVSKCNGRNGQSDWNRSVYLLFFGIFGTLATVSLRVERGPSVSVSLPTTFLTSNGTERRLHFVAFFWHFLLNAAIKVIFLLEVFFIDDFFFQATFPEPTTRNQNATFFLLFLAKLLWFRRVSFLSRWTAFETR